MVDRKGEIQFEKLLIETASTGDFNEIVNLLDCGVLVDANEYNRSLLYANRNFRTPLQIAAKKGKHQCLKYFIEKGADVNAKDVFDVTALHLAAENGHLECLQTLIEAGAECSIPTRPCNGKFRAEMLASLKHSEYLYLGGTTPLHLAAFYNHVDCIKELIENNADVNAVNIKGHTSLYVAAQRGHSGAVLAHLKTTTGMQILSIPSRDTFDTPLHFAVRHGMIKCVKELLICGSCVTQINYFGCSPLHLAIALENENVSLHILKLLFLYGHQPDVNQMDSIGHSALYYTCLDVPQPARRRPEMAKFLLSYGADLRRGQMFVMFIENEFKHDSEDFDILKYIVRSMRHPPDLHRLRRIRQSFEPRWTLYNRRRNFIPQDVDEEIQIVYDHLWVNNGDYSQRALAINNHKTQWYERIASNPRTLQHYCRYTIRSILARSMKAINVLPIPKKIKSYLFLEFGD